MREGSKRGSHRPRRYKVNPKLRFDRKRAERQLRQLERRWERKAAGGA